MKKQEFELSVLDNVKDLMQEQSPMYNRDVNDLDSTRAALSGWSFDKKDKEYRGEMKPELNIPVLDQWVCQVESVFSANPFGVGISSNTNNDLSAHKFVLDKCQDNIADIATRSLVEMIGIGYAYALVTSEVVDAELNWQRPIIKFIDQRKVIVGDCESPDLEDCEIAIVIDVISKAKAEERYDMDAVDLKYSKDVLHGYDIVLDAKYQCSVVTVYEKIKDGVRVSKIVYDKIVEQTILNLDRIPLVRFYADQCYIEKKLHWRGAAHRVAHLWKLINYEISEVQSRVATSPSANFIADSKSVVGNEGDYETGSNVSVLKYASWDGETQLEKPQQINKQLFIDELSNSIKMFSDMIGSLLGQPNPEPNPNETAESVLLRRSSAEASVNKYLKNLKVSMKSLGEILVRYIGILYDVPRIEGGVEIPPLTNVADIVVHIDNGPIQASQKQKNLSQILAFYNMAKESIPTSFQTIGPAILEMSDFPATTKQYLSQMFVNPQQNMPSPEVQAQMQQAQMIVQEKDKQIAALQVALNEYQVDSKAQLMQTQMKIASDERIALAKLQWEERKYQMDIQAKTGKLVYEANQSAEDRQHETDMQTREMMADLEKTRNEQVQNLGMIERPIFTTSKFTS